MENKACEMLFNGFPRHEIAEELDVGPNQLSRHLSDARAKGVAVPHAPQGRPQSDIPTDRLRALYQTLGTYKDVGEAVGMTLQGVRARLRKAA